MAVARVRKRPPMASGGTRSFNEFASKLNFYNDRGGDVEANAEDEPEILQVPSWLSKLGGVLPDSVADAAAGKLAEMSVATQKGMQNVAGMSGQAKAKLQRAGTVIQENAISRERWMYFFIGVALGIGLMSLAFAFLPMIVLMPQKFALLYTLGSLCFLASFAVLRGHVAFLKHLISRSRLAFSATYVVSMVGTLWASLVRRSYVYTMVFCGIQVAALSWFLVSYIPGGTKALSFGTSVIFGAAKRCCRLVCKGKLPV